MTHPEREPGPELRERVARRQRQYPNIVDAYEIARGDYNCSQTERMPGLYVPARPLGASFHWLRATWLVFTGRADALIWPGQRDK